MGISEKDFARLQKNLGIPVEKPRKTAAKKPSGDKYKNHIQLTLMAIYGERLVMEYKFHPVRKWRFDFCIPDLRIAFEYEGIMGDKSRHTNMKGFTNDTSKYNSAQLLGWKVFRYTVLNYKQVGVDALAFNKTKND